MILDFVSTVAVAVVVTTVIMVIMITVMTKTVVVVVVVVMIIVVRKTHHFRSGVNHVHLLQNRCAIVGDDHLKAIKKKI
jgi:hypothetical protein